MGAHQHMVEIVVKVKLLTGVEASAASGFHLLLNGATNIRKKASGLNEHDLCFVAPGPITPVLEDVISWRRKKFNHVCWFKNCGNEAEMVATCSLEEDQVADDTLKPKVLAKDEGKTQYHAVCRHRGCEADIRLDVWACTGSVSPQSTDSGRRLAGNRRSIIAAGQMPHRIRRPVRHTIRLGPKHRSPYW